MKWWTDLQHIRPAAAMFSVAVLFVGLWRIAQEKTATLVLAPLVLLSMVRATILCATRAEYIYAMLSN